MPIMSKKRPTPDPSQTPQPAASRRGAALHVWLDPVLMKALDAYLESLEHPTTKTAVTEAALKALLRGKGFWPPADSEQAGS